MPAPAPDQWRTLSPHLDEALGMTDQERSIWLSSLRIRNPSLVDQLEVLLDRHRELAREGFLQQRCIELPEAGLSGQTLGAYTLRSLIGLGGMGSVWLAERSDARFERRVAVKLLNIALIGKAGEERFKREGIILGRLAHPNIAELIDAGVSPAGQPYLVLEYVAGEQIDRYCDGNRLGIEPRIRLFLEVLEAVAHAHANQIVHRDLKPPNILVRNDGQVKLLDFGISKLHGDDSWGKTLTGEGGRVMTPEYAAPEQLTGAAATTATDVYALGVLLYALLTGRHPHGPGLDSPADLVRAILDIEPSRLSDIVPAAKGNAGLASQHAAVRATTPDRLRRMLRGDLDTITAKALKKDPADRYASVRAFADDLRRFLSREPITARPDSLSYRAGKFVRRRKASVGATLLATLVLIGPAIAIRSISPGQKAEPSFTERRLTANPLDLPVLNATISPNGKYLGYGDQHGLHLQLVETGEALSLPAPPATQPTPAYWVFGGWHPDSSRFITSIAIPEMPVSLWSVSIQAQKWEKLAEVEDLVGLAAISPDASKIAYGRRRSALGAREIWLMGSHGESPHKILTAEDHSSFGAIAWSTAGNRIAFSCTRLQGDYQEVSVKTCDLDGAHPTTIIRDDALNALSWLPAGRLIYSRSTRTGTTGAGELWELNVDDEHGRARGNSRRLADWSGFSIRNFSATADGKRLTFLRGTSHCTIHVADLNANGRRVIDSRRLTMDDNINIALAWTPDSREVVFSAQRAATRQIYRQSLDPGSAPRLVTPAPDTNFYMARFSPDGASLFLEGEPVSSRKMAIYRVGFAGGLPQVLFPVDGLTLYWCTNRTGGLCALGRVTAGMNELAVSRFDTSGISGKDLLRIPLEPGSDAHAGLDYAWHLSSDGSRIGILKRHSNQIRLARLDGGPAKIISLNGYPDLIDLYWAADAQSLFVSSLGPDGARLLHVDLDGDTHPIWLQPETTWLWGLPSPDGRHLAISSEGPEANVWMVDNF
jgi:serine/threonine protein kinase/Tol biopolymer transport system component